MKKYNSYTNAITIKILLCNYISRYNKLIYIASISMIIAAIASVLIIKLSQLIIDEIFVTKRNSILIVALLMVIAFIIKGIAQYYQSYLTKLVGLSIMQDLHLKMYKHLILADLEFLQKFSSGKIVSSFTNDITIMCRAISSCISTARHFFNVIFFTGYIFIFLDQMLSLLALIAFFIAVYITQKLGCIIHKYTYVNQEIFSNYISKLNETFQGIKVVKSYLAEDYEILRAQKKIQEVSKSFTKIAKIAALTCPAMEILNGITIGIIIWYGGLLGIKDQITPGELIGFISAFAAAYRPLVSLLSLNADFQEGLSAAKRIFKILDTKSKIANKNNPIVVNLASSNKIDFVNVSLSLNDRSILHNINFSLLDGETVVLVGKSGSGKTSIANLIMRFYDPSTGSIKLNNQELKDIPIRLLRKNITLVTQETILFNASIAENIAYSCTSANLEQIVDAAKKASAHEFIINMPHGYNTKLGPQGNELSGGQKQRISIARALLKNAPILILDEATTALDQNTEATIYEAIKKYRKDKINIIITYRSHTINFDKIIVLKDGALIEVK
ncbi:ABC transporter family protein [Orientia chuto str. Dubai]|uniref:Multidrug resistance-like ATP-binding protein MdlB n=1 Tax=Orientia chuto str. Dubai TaxID=1359168 RepID=A0A0F3MI06_9RICK|nr:ABC transporter ATP-binding protein [Candidatus Orientia mediorientalis]KJV55395.1 ABC transporter family protein [Orientia chuto str. Dubai]